MTTYAEVNQDGIVTKVFENDGDYYAPADGSFVIQSDKFKENARYEPVAGQFPLAFAFIGTPPAVKANISNNSKKQATTDDEA